MPEENRSISVDDHVVRIHRSGIAACLVTTGGGSSALHRLLASPGASRTVLEAEIPYHAKALARYLGAAPAQAVSPETATRLAGRAYVRAVRAGQGRDRLAGVACTAALATDRERRGDEQAFVAVRTADELLLMHMSFEKGILSRAEQEEVVGRALIRALAQVVGLPPLPLAGVGVAGLEEQRSACGSPLDDLAAGNGDVVVIEADGRMHADPGRVQAILAGSLNPLHAGHLAMAETAEACLGRRVDFEVSLFNADKSPITPHEALARIQCLAWRRRTLATRAPTFVEKARLLPGCCFVVGHDTALRIVQASFYGGREKMLSALDEVGERGCGFLVAGRVREGAFLGLDAVSVPAGYDELFEEIPERVFREDISSTAIRAAREAGRTER